MKSLIHGRGDVLDMFLFFLMLMLGLWQLLVAWKKLNGLSLTGYPDRKYWSIACGLVLIIASGTWYFSQPGHFASPDVEGIESFILLAFGMLAATALQFILSLVLQRTIARFSRTQYRENPASVITKRLQADIEGSQVPTCYFQPPADTTIRIPVLLMHDYGGKKEDMEYIARFLASEGHPALTFDMDGHGKNPRGLSGQLMKKTLNMLIDTLCRVADAQNIAVVGTGLGGLTALLSAGSGKSTRVVAIDPTTFGPDGACAINALRELDILDVIAALITPNAVDTNGKNVGLPGIVDDIKFTGNLPIEKVAVIATKDTWLNSPAASKAFALNLNLKEPLWVTGNHYSLIGNDEVHNLILKNIRT